MAPVPNSGLLRCGSRSYNESLVRDMAVGTDLSAMLNRLLFGPVLQRRDDGLGLGLAGNVEF
jgi:hypothetical protein